MADQKNNGDGYDWIETVVKLAGLVGMNQIRVRWKLRLWHDKTVRAKSSMKSRADQVVRKHKTCPRCRSINSFDDTVCHKCGAKLLSREMEVVNRFLRHFDLGLSAETFLAVAFVAVFCLEVYRGGQGSIFGANTDDLVAMGGFSPMDIARGEFYAMSAFGLLKTRWYTLLTAVFLHAGAIHLIFNVYSLMYIAPISRQIFNSGKVMLVFIVTGVAASLVSLYWRMEVSHQLAFVGIGASGAICGLIGLMIVWGHRDGTFSGMTFRNQMGRWVLYILVYGYLLGADNTAHIGGLLAGGAFGFVLSPDFQRAESRIWKGVEVVSWAIVAAAVTMITFLTFTIPQIPPSY